MGNAFSGPDAFKWLGFTKEATAVLQANPYFLLELLMVLLSCVAIGLIAWYIHFETNKPYYKPKPKKDDKKGGKK